MAGAKCGGFPGMAYGSVWMPCPLRASKAQLARAGPFYSWQCVVFGARPLHGVQSGMAASEETIRLQVRLPGMPGTCQPR